VPKISIGLMVYNESEHIARTIDNISKQSFSDYELLIGDNASDDGSSEIINGFAENDSRIVHIKRPKNIGAIQNWNDLVRRAKAEYFVLAAGHDLLSVDYLKALSEELDRNKNAVLAFASTQWKDESNNNLSVPVSILDTSGMPPFSRFVSLMFANQHYMYGMSRISAMRETSLQKEVIGSGELYLQELVQLGDFVLVENQRWYRVKNRSDEPVMAKMHRYHHILFSGESSRLRFQFFPHTQMLFHYLVLPFVVRNITIWQRLVFVSAYPILLVRFVKPIVRDVQWLLKSKA